MPIAKLARLSVFYRERPASGAPTKRVVLIHGNVSSGVFFEPLMASLPADYHVVAPDLRGFGATDSAPIDATRGLRDFSDDVAELITSLGWQDHEVHVLGWSVGGGVAMQLAIDHPKLATSLTLVNPVPPKGFGGTHGADSRANEDDFAGSGGGAVSGDFLDAIRTNQRGEGPGLGRTILRSFFFHPETYQPPPELEERFLDGMYATRLGASFYPGDSVPSSHWPGSAPGTRGMNNSFSPRHQDLTPFADVATKPRVLWVRGARDQIVSDTSFFDLAYLGKLGLVPGWPGDERCPPQPMIAQTEALLARYEARGGAVRRVVFDRAGHSPFLECPAEFLEAFTSFLA